MQGIASLRNNTGMPHEIAASGYALLAMTRAAVITSLRANAVSVAIPNMEHVQLLLLSHAGDCFATLAM